MTTDQPPVTTSGVSSSRRNLITLFAVAVLIGFGGAIYEVALPLFLKQAGLSWRTMGWIYGAGAIVTFLARVALGAWSDRVGRKLIYVWSLLLTGVATTVTPFFAGAWAQAAFKSVTDPLSRVRDAMYSVLLYETWTTGFQRIFSKTRGVEFLFHFVGLLATAGILGWIARQNVGPPHVWAIAAAGILLLVSGVMFAALYRENPLPSPARPIVSWRDLIRLQLTRPMWVLTISFFVFNFGITVSHSFALQLFFQEKYGATDSQIFVIGALHRLSSALTLLFLGHVFRDRLRFWLMLFVVLEGVFLAAPGFLPAAGPYRFGVLVLPALWTAVAVWLAHDFLGMGLWLPIQQILILRHSRPESRGEEISLSTAIAALGCVPAPFVAGWLRAFPGLTGDFAVNLPFIVSGIGVAASAIILLWLPKE